MPEELDPAAVVRALGMEPSGPCERVSGGWDTTIYRFTTADGIPHALRIYPSPDRATSAAREVAALGALAGHIPAPRVEANGTWEVRPALVISWIPGQPLLKALGTRPWNLWRIGIRFGRAHARIHEIAAPAALRTDSPESWLRRAGDDQAVISSVRALNPVRDRLIHLDYHPLNVMIRDGRISGVLDWANADAGDPRADVAVTRALLETAPLPPGGTRQALRLLRGILIRAWWSGYQQHAGRVEIPPAFLAWAGAVRVESTARQVGGEGVWATDEDVATVRRWTVRWRLRAGLDPG